MQNFDLLRVFMLQEIRLTQEVESLCAVGKWQECIDICDRPNVLPTSGLFYVHLASACVQCQNYDAAVSCHYCMLAWPCMTFTGFAVYKQDRLTISIV